MLVQLTECTLKSDLNRFVQEFVDTLSWLFGGL